MLLVSDALPMPAAILFLVTPVAALVLFALWAVVLVLAIGIWRVSLILMGQARANGFNPGTPHGSDRYWRLNRAHINTLENLPIFGAVVIACHIAGVANSGEAILLSGLALVFRVVQSLIHIASGSPLAVTFRFLAFGVQLLCFIGLGLVALNSGAL